MAHQTPWTRLVASIHASGVQVVWAVTGGGTKAISQFLEVPGGSLSMLEAVIPYSEQALHSWLQGNPDQSCSGPTSRAMAMAAWMRARELATHDNVAQLVGLGATASLASNRPKRGEHRIHVSTQTSVATCSRSLTLQKGSRDRKKEEWLAAKLLLITLAEACDVDASEARAALESQLTSEEQIVSCCQVAESAWSELLLGTRRSVCWFDNQQDGALPRAVLSGAFNPIHQGHRRMARSASERLGLPVAYELSITNVDKPPLDFCELYRRLDQICREDQEAQIVLTAAPTFREKAQLLPGCTFVVGADTIQRIADPRYYEGSQQQRDAAIHEIAHLGCRFLVYGRELAGQFRVLRDIDLPTALQELCDEVPADEFREDISSTALRREWTNSKLDRNN